MNNDGWEQVGVGQSDMRVAGKDLQHNRQTRTADELHMPIRTVRQNSNMGGPMKESIQKNTDLSLHLENEKARHMGAKKHSDKHLEKHYTRNHDSQYGQDDYRYED